MADFLVGQWVECVDNDSGQQPRIHTGSIYRVKQINDATFVMLEDVCGEFAAWRFRPFAWQVGRTYRTTLEGVTATIAEVDSDGDLWGNDSTERNYTPKWCWSGKTGILFERKDDENAPRLTPYLADPEPSKSETEPTPVEPASQINPPSRYHRTINGVTLDLYDIAGAWDIDSHRIFHAVKKLIMAGRRGHKDREQDLREAIVSIESELRKMKGGA